MLSSITVLFNVCKSILILVLSLMHQVVSYTISRHEIHNKGNKALFKLRKTFWDDAPKVTTVLHIFNHPIRPILLYGSFWDIFLPVNISTIRVKTKLPNSEQSN